MTTDTFKPGLEGVIAGSTDICCVDQGKLLYRGYPISELAEKVSFEEVAHLLLHGDLPNTAALAKFRTRIDQFRGLPPEVVRAIASIPKEAPMMDVLRTGVSMAGHFSRIKGDSVEALRDQATWLMAVTADVVGARYRLLHGKEPVAAKSGLSHAAQILHLCHGIEPDDTSTRLLDLTLVLYAEHDFNASTFTARVIGSTTSDMVSSITGAIGALKGPLHGGANERAMELLSRFKSADEAAAWVKDALVRKERVMGFGHRVYKNGDHRARILEREMRNLAEQKGRMDLVAIYDANVLYPASLRDLLIRLAQTGLFQAKWTDQILDETINAIVLAQPELADRLQRTRELMNDAIRDVRVTGYEHLIDGRQPKSMVVGLDGQTDC